MCCHRAFCILVSAPTSMLRTCQQLHCRCKGGPGARNACVGAGGWCRWSRALKILLLRERAGYLLAHTTLLLIALWFLALASAGRSMISYSVWLAKSVAVYQHLVSLVCVCVCVRALSLSRSVPASSELCALASHLSCARAGMSTHKLACVRTQSCPN